MSIHRLVFTAVLLAPGAGSLGAAQMWVDDLRLCVGSGVAPTSASEDYHGNGVPGADADGIYDYENLDRASAFEVMAGYFGGRIWWNGGFVWGAGVEAIGGRYRAPLASNDQMVDINDVGPFIQFGWGYAFTHWTHLEMVGFMSGGSANGGWVDDASTTTVKKANGGYFQAGVRIGFYWVLARHLLLGFQGELSDMVSSIGVDNPNGSHSDLDIYSGGGALQGVIGVHF